MLFSLVVLNALGVFTTGTVIGSKVNVNVRIWVGARSSHSSSLDMLTPKMSLAYMGPIQQRCFRLQSDEIPYTYCLITRYNRTGGKFPVW